RAGISAIRDSFKQNTAFAEEEILMAQQQPDISLAGVETSERPLLGEQTAGNLIRNVWRVYCGHFVPIVLTYFLPTFPLLLLAQMVRGTSPIQELVATFAYIVSAFAASGALTVALSDICLARIMHQL